MMRHPTGTRFYARCPGCGDVTEYAVRETAISDWNGETYLWSCCGSRAHLDPAKGGAETWWEEPTRAVAEVEI